MNNLVAFHHVDSKGLKWLENAQHAATVKNRDPWPLFFLVEDDKLVETWLRQFQSDLCFHSGTSTDLLELGSRQDKHQYLQQFQSCNHVQIPVDVDSGLSFPVLNPIQPASNVRYFWGKFELSAVVDGLPPPLPPPAILAEALRFVVVLREPSERLLSEYSRYCCSADHDFTLGTYGSKCSGASLDQIIFYSVNTTGALLNNQRHVSNLIHKVSSMVLRGYYTSILERWFRILPRRQFFVLNYIWASERKVQDAVLRFLGLTGSTSLGMRETVIQRSGRTISIDDVSCSTRELLARHFAPHVALLPTFLASPSSVCNTSHWAPIINSSTSVTQQLRMPHPEEPPFAPFTAPVCTQRTVDRVSAGATLWFPRTYLEFVHEGTLQKSG